MIEIRQLRYFLVLADELHFARAAARLHIAQPAVSQQLRRLESELGVVLVDRTSRRVSLTDAGVRFLPHAQSVLDALDRGRAAVREPAADATVRVGTCEGLGGRLPRMLRAVQIARPGVRIELVRLPEPRRVAAVADGELDAALVHTRVRRRGLLCTGVWRDELLAVLPADHPLAATPDAVDVAELVRLPLRTVDRDRNPALHDALDAVATRSAVTIRRGPAVADDLLATVAARPPSWSVFYPEQALLTNASAAGVAFVRVEPPITMTTYLVVPRSSPTQHLFRDACASAA